MPCGFCLFSPDRVFAEDLDHLNLLSCFCQLLLLIGFGLETLQSSLKSVVQPSLYVLGKKEKEAQFGRLVKWLE